MRRKFLQSYITYSLESAQTMDAVSDYGLVIQVQRGSDGIWRIMHLSELIGKPYFRNQYKLSDIFFFDQETSTHIGSGLPPAFLDQLEQARIPFSLTWLR